MKHSIGRLTVSDSVTWLDSRFTKPSRDGLYLVVSFSYMSGLVDVRQFFKGCEKNCITEGFYRIGNNPQRSNPDNEILFWSFIESIRLPEEVELIGKVEFTKEIT